MHSYAPSKGPDVLCTLDDVPVVPPSRRSNVPRIPDDMSPSSGKIRYLLDTLIPRQAESASRICPLSLYTLRASCPLYQHRVLMPRTRPLYQRTHVLRAGATPPPSGTFTCLVLLSSCPLVRAYTRHAQTETASSGYPDAYRLGSGAHNTHAVHRTIDRITLASTAGLIYAYFPLSRISSPAGRSVLAA